MPCADETWSSWSLAGSAKAIWIALELPAGSLPEAPDGAPIAALGDHGQVGDIARDHGTTHIGGDAADGVELDVAAPRHLDAVGLRRRDRAVTGGDAAKREAVLAAEVDIGQRLGRDRDRVVEDDEVLLRQADRIGRDMGGRVRHRADGELAGTG